MGALFCYAWFQSNVNVVKLQLIVKRFTIDLQKLCSFRFVIVGLLKYIDDGLSFRTASDRLQKPYLLFLHVAIGTGWGVVCVYDLLWQAVELNGVSLCKENRRFTTLLSSLRFPCQ